MFKKIQKQINWWVGVICTGVLVGASLQFARAWVDAPASPPGGNVGAPLTTSIKGQVKEGALGVGLNVKSSKPGLIVYNGKVGIGTDDPQKKLDVIGGAYISGMLGVGNSDPQAKLDVNGSALFSGSVGIGGRIYDKKYVKFDILDEGQDLFVLMNQKLTGNWPPVKEIGTVTFQSTGNGAGNIAFALGNGELMRISNSGNVGIGTQNPLGKLHIQTGPNSVAETIRWTSGDAAIQMCGPGGCGYFGMGSDNDNFYIGGTPNGIGAQYPTMSIEGNGGNVGIGTLNPHQKLDVEGNVKAQIYYDNDTSYFMNMDDYSNIKYVTVDGIRIKAGDIAAGNVLVSDGDGWARWVDPCWAVRNCACN